MLVELAAAVVQMAVSVAADAVPWLALAVVHWLAVAAAVVP